MRNALLAAATVAVLASAGLAAAQEPQQQRPSAADVIKRWDTNGDGAVSKDEWVAAGRPAERFDAVDTNHDGKITADELTAAMARMQQMRQGGAGAPGGEHPQGAPPQSSAQPH